MAQAFDYNVFSIQLFASIMNKKNRQCGYYKYMVKEDKEKQFCYLLRSCAKRMIDNINCPLGQNNFLEVRFFVPNLESCAEYCRDTQGRVANVMTVHDDLLFAIKAYINE